VERRGLLEEEVDEVDDVEHLVMRLFFFSSSLR